MMMTDFEKATQHFAAKTEAGNMFIELQTSQDGPSGKFQRTLLRTTAIVLVRESDEPIGAVVSLLDGRGLCCKESVDEIFSRAAGILRRKAGGE